MDIQYIDILYAKQDGEFNKLLKTRKYDEKYVKKKSTLYTHGH